MDGAGAVSSLVASLDPRGRREQALYAALHTRGSCAGAEGAVSGSPELLGAALEAAFSKTSLSHVPLPAADDSTMEVLAIRTVAADLTAKDAAAPLTQAARRGGNLPAPASLRLYKLRAEMHNTIRALPGSAFQSPDPSHLADAAAGAAGVSEVLEGLEAATSSATTMTHLRTALAKLQGAISPRFFSANFRARQVAPVPAVDITPCADINDAHAAAAAAAAAAATAANDAPGGFPSDTATVATAGSAAPPATAAAATALVIGEAHIPCTSAAVALHILSLDAALRYSPSRAPARETLDGYLYIQRPTTAVLPPTKLHKSKDAVNP
jgi:hypothetical protein